MAKLTQTLTLELSLEEAMAIRYVLGTVMVKQCPDREIYKTSTQVFDCLCDGLPISKPV